MDWTSRLHGFWTTALAATSDDELAAAAGPALLALPAAVLAWGVEVDSGHRRTGLRRTGGDDDGRARIGGLLDERPGPVTATADQAGDRTTVAGGFTVPGGGRAALAVIVAGGTGPTTEFGQVADVVRHAVTRLTEVLSRADAAGRDALLAEASVQMDAVLDASQTLHRAARMAVPAVAEGCLVYLREGDRLRRRAAVHVDSRRQQALAGDGPAVRWLDELAVGTLGAPSAPASVPPGLAGTLGARSADVQVLRARGRVLGALVFLLDRPAHRHPEPEFLRDLTYRAALAIDNSELYEQRRRDVMTLQNHLLPGRLSAVDGASTAADYAVEEGVLEVGGDFYDVVPRPRGGGAALIGDVCGRGAAAAALTGLARHTLGTLLRQGLAAERALSQLNDELRRNGSWRFVTAAVATFTPDGHDGLLVRLASAGHPPPLLVRSAGRVTACRAGGIPLGVLDRLKVGQSRVRMAAGDTLLMYTDGLTEARDPAGRMFEEAGLPAALEKLAGAPVQTMAEELTRAATAFRVCGADDIAVLAVRAGTGEADDRG